MFRRWVTLGLRKPWSVAAVWLLAAGALVVAAPPLQQVGAGDASFLPSSAPSQRADELMARLFPDDPTRDAAVIVLSRAGGLRAEDHAYVSGLDEALKSRFGDDVGAVQSVAGNPDLATFLRSQDGAAELVVANLRHAPFSPPGNDAVARLRAELDRTAPPGLAHQVTGIGALAADQAASLVDSFNRTAIVTVVLVLGILLWVYRSPVAAAVPLVTIGVAFLVARGLVAFLASAGFKVAGLVETFMVVMTFGAGTDYCLFIVSRYRQELRSHRDTSSTLGRTMAVVGAVIVASAVTVIVGFLSQLSAQFGVYRTMGPALGLGIAVALLASLTLTPALLRLVGRRAFWPARIEKVRESRDDEARGWSTVARVVRRRPAAVLLAGVIALLLPAAGLGWYAQSFDIVRELPAKTDARAGFEAVDRHFGGGRVAPLYVVVADDRSIVDDPAFAAIDRLTDRLSDTPGIAEVRSITQPAGAPLTLESLGTLTGGVSDPVALGIDPAVTDLAPFVAALESPQGVRLPAGLVASQPRLAKRLQFLQGDDGRSTRLIVTLEGSPYGGRALETIHRVDEIAADAMSGSSLAGARLAVGGPGAFYADMQDVGNRDFRVMFSVLLAAIFLVLALLLRSVVAPVYLLLTVLLSYAATMGFTVLVFVQVLGEEGLSFWLPPFLFIILVALGADYNIFIMGRIREEAQSGLPVEEASVRGLLLTGRTITSAGLILAGTFAALLLSPLPSMRQVGFAVTFGVLIDTFVVRSLMVPATTSLLGSWAFWPAGVRGAPSKVRPRHVAVAGVGLVVIAGVLVAVAFTAAASPPVTRVPF